MWIDGDQHDTDPMKELSEVESEIENVVYERADEAQTTVVRVLGAHGWRKFEMANGDVIDFRWEHAPIDYRCSGCGYDTSDEGYMVNDAVWTKAGFTAGWFCIGCFESALGRRVESSAFLDLPMNTDPRRRRSERLRDRLGEVVKTEPKGPLVTYDAPIGSVDLEAFDEEGNAIEITGCDYCLPWRAEVVFAVEDNRPMVREWHAAECSHLVWLLKDEDTD
ncbi:hypothetical protein [Nocardia sp. NPDC005366]|uniref:hypothetical protein n=1 Tax=Nocardia sp. NPDC005366 TaxID=3156878 RepID=UPI0033AB469C